MMEMYVVISWSFSHACVLSSFGSCNLWRSALMMSCWLWAGRIELGFVRSDSRICGVGGYIVGMDSSVGVGVLWWNCGWWYVWGLRGWGRSECIGCVSCKFETKLCVCNVCVLG